jgi:hypothetical protein
MTKISEQEKEVLRKLERGRHDIVYFAEEVLGIKLNRAQRRWFRFVKTKDDGFSWWYKFIIHVAANQVGKTLGLAVLILWACNYKIGLDNTDGDNWYNSPYQWYHIAPSLNQANLVLSDIRMILKNVHPAQEKSGLKSIFPQGFALEVTVENYYPGLQFWNGAVANFRTTEEKARGLLGRRAAGISFDECAFEAHLIEIVNTVLWMRLISTGGPLFLVSTPNGMNDFFELVSGVEQGAIHEDMDPQVWAKPEQQEVLILSTVEDNVGFGITQEEVDRMYESLDPATRDQQLRGAFIATQDAFFVPQSAILKAFNDKLPEHTPPQPGHKYVIFHDPSVSSDPTASMVIDVTTKPYRGVYYSWDKMPKGIHQLIPDIWGLHAQYNSAVDRLGRFPTSKATTGYDATSMGGQIIRQSLAGLTPQRAINFGGTGKVKRDALTNLRAAMLQGDVVFPGSWHRFKRELLNYKLDDKKIEQDSVIAGAGALSLVGSTGSAPKPFNTHARARR